MVVSCEEVWREISDYLDGDGTPELRSSMEEHFRGCRHCSAVKEGTGNMIHIFADERLFELPSGFSQRLQRRLGATMPPHRASGRVWMMALAATAVVVLIFEVGELTSRRSAALRSEHAQPAIELPPQMVVTVSDGGRVFHEASCSFIHDRNPHGISAEQALGKGYSPCTRCMRRYLESGFLPRVSSRSEASYIRFTPLKVRPAK